MLIGFPLGLLSVTPLCDWLGRMLGSEQLGVVAYYDELLGLIFALVAAVPGALDLVKLDKARLGIALWHAGIMLLTLSLFGVSLGLRSRAAPSLGVCVLDSIAALTLALGGWFGGELVFGHGVGVASRAPTNELPSGTRGQA